MVKKAGKGNVVNFFDTFAVIFEMQFLAFLVVVSKNKNIFGEFWDKTERMLL